jgi:hypothetical protein
MIARTGLSFDYAWRVRDVEGFLSAYITDTFQQNCAHEANGRCINGAIIPSPAETTRIKNDANPAEYQLSCANGVAGRAKVHATYATVAAAISHSGHFEGEAGIALPADFIFEANAIHTVNGVAPRKHQNGSQRPTCKLCAPIVIVNGPSAAIALTYRVNTSVGIYVVSVCRAVLGPLAAATIGTATAAGGAVDGAATGIGIDSAALAISARLAGTVSAG